MYRVEDIRDVHIELTTRCNAACPQCARNISGGPPNPNLPLDELSLDDVRTILPPEFVAQLTTLYVCGNYGDPMVAPDTLEIFRYLRGANRRVHLGMITNGSGRSPEWWAELAKIASYVRFSIDGLEDTNHIYRRQTQWPKIMASVQAFIAAGGNAEWDFIVFRHNEHQVEAARALAKELGFKRFFVKKTGRFFSMQGPQKRKVIDRDGKFEYEIEEPSDPQYKNDAVVQLRREKSFDAYQATTEIACKAIKGQHIYVSAEGLVFPCCFTAAIYPSSPRPGINQIWKLIEQLPEGKGSLDGKKHSLAEIIGGPFYQEQVPAGWAKRPLSEGRLEPCVRTCGELDTHSAQFSGSSL